MRITTRIEVRFQGYISILADKLVILRFISPQLLHVRLPGTKLSKSAGKAADWQRAPCVLVPSDVSNVYVNFKHILEESFKTTWLVSSAQSNCTELFQMYNLFTVVGSPGTALCVLGLSYVRDPFALWSKLRGN